MLGIDTNILVRYLVEDEARQSALAAEILEERCTMESPGYVSAIVMVELFWTLRRAYGYTREEVANTLHGLLRAKELIYQHHDEVRRALQAYRTREADFADALLGAVAQSDGCSTTLTFDQRAARLSEFTYAGE